MVTNEIIEKIIEKADIVEVVSNYVSLEKAGSNYRGLCPFHDDHSPSFFVSPTKKIATCMSCKEGGNVINFVRKIEKISMDEACKKLGDRYGIDVKIKQQTKNEQNFKKLYDITDFSTKFYQIYLNNSLNGKEAKKYLHNRNLSDETINMFKIGLAPSSRNSLYLTLKDQGFLELDMLEAGVIKKSNEYYDLFTNRIIFPIIDENNKTIGYSARIFNNEENQSKYINSAENKIFNKSNVLYNINNALFDIRRKNRMIITEGQMDVIACFNAGLKEVVCTMGTALTPSHIEKIKKYTNNVILCYDGDQAGQKATLRAIELFNKERINVSVLKLKDNLDPDEYINKYGKEAFVKLFDTETLNTNDYLYLNAKEGKNLSSSNDMESFKMQVFKLCNGFNSNTLKDIYLTKLANDINVSKEIILSDFQRYYTRDKALKGVEKKSSKQNFKIKNGTIDAYRKLLCHLFTNRSIAHDIHFQLHRILDSQKNYIEPFEDDYIHTTITGLIYKKYNLAFDDYAYAYNSLYNNIIYNYYREHEEMDRNLFEKSYLDEKEKELYEDLKKEIYDVSNQNERDECLDKIKALIIKMGIDKVMDLKKSTDPSNLERIHELFNIQVHFKQELNKIKK